MSMASGARPPVNEVVVSVAFDPQACLTGPQLFVTLRNFLADFSSIEEKVPYVMPVELPPEVQLAQPTVPPVQFIDGSKLPGRRYWLTDASDPALLVQIQADYLAVNWRKVKDDSPYIGFERLLERFVSVLARVQEAVDGAGGSRLAVRQAELSYVNLIRPDALWSSHREIGAVVNAQSPVLADFEQLNVAFTRSLADARGAFSGRLSSVAQTAFVADNENVELSRAATSELVPIVNISTTVRSARLDRAGVDAAREFFLAAHDEAGLTFRQITTGAAREHWGMR
jgi:uncharacterized protein (TIGR04255 family)